MKQKRVFIILGAIGIIFLLIFFGVVTLVIKNLWGANKTVVPPAVNLTLCDEYDSDLCIVTFGTNSLNRMVINFQLPDADYAAFYVKAANRGTVNMYSCKVSEAIPTSAYCTGVRTPLGETLDIEVYNTAEDTLIARGTFLVSAIALATPISLPSETPNAEETPTAFSTPLEDGTPTQSESTLTPTLTPTSTPGTGYPNP
jgi:hypothetical protein